MASKRSRLRVLLVEDNPSVRSFIVDALLDSAEVVEAADATEALEVLALGPPRRFHLIIVDCILPGRCGVDPLVGIGLVQTIATRWPWMPVIAITGAVEAERLVIEAFRSGARDFLKKPFGVRELADAIARVTSRRPGRPRRASTAEPAIRRAIAFIGDHYTDPISLGSLAEMARMSRSHFCRTFRVVVGTSFRDYIRDLRLARAQQLLAMSKQSLTQIAQEAGFYDLPHLDKAFRKRFGISPTEFQRRKDLAHAGEAAPPPLPRAESR